MNRKDHPLHVKSRKRRAKGAKKRRPPSNRLSPSARKIEMFLLGEIGICGSIMITPEELGPLVHYSASTVIIALRQLKRDRRIAVKRGRGRGNMNTYTLLPKARDRFPIPTAPWFVDK